MDGRFPLVVLEPAPLDELRPAPICVATVVQGLLVIAERFGEEEVVVLEAILVHELGLLDADVLFSRIRLVRS